MSSKNLKGLLCVPACPAGRLYAAFEIWQNHQQTNSGVYYSLCCWSLAGAALPSRKTQQRRDVFFGTPATEKKVQVVVY